MFRRSSPIRISAVHPSREPSALCVSDRHPQPFRRNRSRFSPSVSRLPFSAAPRHLFACLLHRTSTDRDLPSIETLSHSVCRLYSSLRHVKTTSHSVKTPSPSQRQPVFPLCLFFNFAGTFLHRLKLILSSANANSSFSYRAVPFSPSLCRLRLCRLPLRIRFLYRLEHRHLGEVHLFSSVLFGFRRLFVSCADTSIVSAKRKVTVAFAW
jgi:hypothetical protein